MPVGVGEAENTSHSLTAPTGLYAGFTSNLS